MTYKQAVMQLRRVGAAHATGPTLAAMYAQEIAAKWALRPEPIYSFLRRGNRRIDTQCINWGLGGCRSIAYAMLMAGVMTRLPDNE